MSIKTKTNLKVEADANINTNGTNAITGALHNAMLTNTFDSVVSIIDAENVAGVKTFGSFPVTPSSAPTTDYQVANKKYVDDNEVDGLWGDDGTDVTLITPRDVDLGDNTIDTKRLLQSNNGDSIFIGENTGAADDLSTNRNIFIGKDSGIVNTSGSNNIGLGYRSLYSNITAGGNFALGIFSLSSNTDAGNVAIGTSALMFKVTGQWNIAIGNDAGRYYGNVYDLDELITVAGCSYIGGLTAASADDVTNEAAIGYAAVGNGSNTTTIGNNNVTDVYMAGDAGAIVHAGQYTISALNTAPASASATGTLGDIRYTTDYIYICTATDTWKRTALTTW